jgi:UDPglucose 6-dehydrogenase
VGSDSRIGGKYLKPGLSFGGPCFPRDNRMIAYTARQCGLEAPLAEATDRVNELTKEALVAAARQRLSPGGTVAVLGMAYKPDTYIVEESAGLHLAQRLKQFGHRVLVHDYVATRANSPSLLEFDVLDDPGQLATHPDVELAVLCCPSPQYRQVIFPPSLPLLDPWGLSRPT